MLYASDYGIIPYADVDNSAKYSKLFEDAIYQSKTVYIEKGWYNCKNSITINFDTLCNGKYHLNIIGNGSTLNFINCNGLILQINNDGIDSKGNFLDYRYFGYFNITNLIIFGTEGVGTGIQIGRTNREFDSYGAYNSFEHVTVQGFNVGMKLINARHITMDKVIIRDCTGNNSSCVILEAHSNDKTAFTGDLIMNGCEIIGTKANNCFRCSGTRTVTMSTIGGIHINHCYIYGNNNVSTPIIDGGNASIRFMDWLIDGCQIDQHGNGALLETYPEKEWYSLRLSINIDNCWFTNIGCIVKGNYINGLNITNCNSLVTKGILKGYFNDNIIISNNSFKESTKNSIEVGGSRSLLINNNIFTYNDKIYDHNISFIKANAIQNLSICNNIFDTMAKPVILDSINNGNVSNNTFNNGIFINQYN